MSGTPHGPPTPARPFLAGVAFVLFLVWSNSFVAMSYLLGGERAVQRLDWLELTTARYLVAGSTAGLYVALARRAEAWALVRRHPIRLLASGALTVPAYNASLYYAQQHGVSPPVASLTTALTPLFVLLLSAAFLGERMSRQRLAGLAVACAGMLVIATARGGLDARYPAMVALAAAAPLAWSIFTVLSKPLTRYGSPLVWSYLALFTGMLFVLPWAPRTWPRALALDAGGWGALLYLAWPCAVGGNAVWTWLLRFLPANTVGFTVFLNPPLTTASKALLSAAFPSVFVFSVVGQEWVGAAIVLAGLALALLRRTRTRRAV